jgi:Gram-negative bacterial TonB protein C-terminal
MKDIALLTIALFVSTSPFSQNVKQDLLNRYFEVTTEEKEAFFVRLSQAYKGYWAYTDYDGKSRIVRTGFYTDSTFKIPVGPHTFSWEGKLKYKGSYVEGSPSGYWYFFNEKGKLYDSLHYVVKSTGKTAALVDSTNAEEEKKKTALLQQEHLKNDSTSTFTTVEVEAKFPGGEKGWTKHISKQLSFPDLVMAINKPQKMTIEVQFVVCKDGEVCSVEALNSSTPLLDIMAVNAIRKGPRWDPAFQSGRNVKAWRRQKITFIIPE